MGPARPLCEELMVVPPGCSPQLRMPAMAGDSILRMLLVLTALAAAAFLVQIEIESVGSAGFCESELFPAANSTGLDAALLELIARGWLSASDHAICVGPGAAPAAAAMQGLGLHAAAIGYTAAPPAPCCGLPLATASFDFAFSAALDRVRVPARVVLEMERVIRPGRFGAVRRGRHPGPAGLARAAAPVSALLRASDVVGALPVDGAAIVVFRKRGGAVPDPAGAGGGGSWCGDAKITKLPLALDDVIDQLKVAFLPELIKFQAYPETSDETTSAVAEE